MEKLCSIPVFREREREKDDYSGFQKSAKCLSKWHRPRASVRFVSNDFDADTKTKPIIEAGRWASIPSVIKHVSSMWIHRDVLAPRAIEIDKCVMRPIIGELKFVSRIVGCRLINKFMTR